MPHGPLRKVLFTSAAAVALLLSACQVGPDFHTPAPPMATAGYVKGGLPAAIAPDQRLAAGADVPARWWEAYGSPELNALMDQAIKASPDIESATAALRSEAARASASLIWAISEACWMAAAATFAVRAR